MENKTNIIIAVFVLGISFGAYEFYDFWTNEFPRLRQEEAQQAQVVAGLENDVVRLQSFAKNIQAIKQEFRELNLQLEAALEHMPRTFNLASLLRKLTMLAQNSGIDISVFRPRRELAQAKPPPQPGAPPKAPENGVFYDSILVEFSLNGPFTQSMMFFDQLARLKRIVNIDSIKMTIRKESQVGRLDQVSVVTDVIVRTYRFIE